MCSRERKVWRNNNNFMRLELLDKKLESAINRFGNLNDEEKNALLSVLVEVNKPAKINLSIILNAYPDLIRELSDFAYKSLADNKHLLAEFISYLNGEQIEMILSVSKKHPDFLYFLSKNLNNKKIAFETKDPHLWNEILEEEERFFKKLD